MTPQFMHERLQASLNFLLVVGRTNWNDTCEMLCELESSMYLFHNTNTTSVISQDWLQDNCPLCCSLHIRGDETVHREVWMSIRGLLWAEPPVCPVRAGDWAWQDGWHLQGLRSWQSTSTPVTQLLHNHLWSWQVDSISPAGQKRKLSLQRFLSCPKSHSYWVKSWAHTWVLGLWAFEWQAWGPQHSSSQLPLHSACTGHWGTNDTLFKCTVFCKLFKNV